MELSQLHQIAHTHTHTHSRVHAAMRTYPHGSVSCKYVSAASCVTTFTSSPVVIVFIIRERAHSINFARENRCVHVHRLTYLTASPERGAMRAYVPDGIEIFSPVDTHALPRAGTTVTSALLTSYLLTPNTQRHHTKSSSSPLRTHTYISINVFPFQHSIDIYTHSFHAPCCF